MFKAESKRRLKGESRGHAGVVKGSRKRKRFPSTFTNTSTPADCCDLCRVGLQDKVSLQDNCRGVETVDQSDSNIHIYTYVGVGENL